MFIYRELVQLSLAGVKAHANRFMDGSSKTMVSSSILSTRVGAGIRPASPYLLPRAVRAIAVCEEQTHA